MKISSGKRDLGIDALRLFCAFSVVCIHVPFGQAHFRFVATRTAVPIFAMITGYYYSGLAGRDGKSAQIRKILKLTAFSMLFYLFWNMVHSFFNGRLSYMYYSFPEFAVGWLRYFFFSPEMNSTRIQFILFNRTICGEHLWYLCALLYVLLLVAAVEHLVERRYLYPLIPVLIALNFVLGSYSPFFFGKRLNIEISRNFLLTILPFFLLGDYLRSNDKRGRISTRLLLMILIVSLLVGNMEKAFLGEEELLLSTVFLATALFLLAARCRETDNSFLQKAAEWGRKYSVGIYIWHYFLWQALDVGIRIMSLRFPEAAKLERLISPVSLVVILLLALSLKDWLKSSLYKITRQGESESIQ